MKPTKKLEEAQSTVALGQIKRWYDNFYAGKGEDAGRPLSAYKVFLDRLKVRGGALLDIGCGTGYLLKQAEQKGLMPYGLDISEEAGKVAKKVATKSEVIVADAQFLPFKDKTFDYITILGTLEHFLHPDVAVKEMHRVCKDNGQLCIVVPNSYHLFDILGVLRTGYSHAGTVQPYEYLATLNEWRDFLEGGGFIVFKVFQDKGPPIKFISLSSIVRAFMPLALTYQFVFILKKSSEVG